MIFQYFPMIFQDISIILSPSAPRQVAGAGFESKSSVEIAWVQPLQLERAGMVQLKPPSCPARKSWYALQSRSIFIYLIHIYIIYVCVHTIIYEYIYICVQILKLLHDFWWAWHRFSMILDARPHRGAEVWICPWQLWAWRHLLGACWSIGIPLSNKAVVSKNNLDWCCPYCRQLCMKYMGLT